MIFCLIFVAEIVLFIISAVILKVQQKREFCKLEKIVTFVVFTALMVFTVIIEVYDYILLGKNSFYILLLMSVQISLYLLFRKKINNLSRFYRGVLIVAVVILNSVVALIG